MASGLWPPLPLPPPLLPPPQAAPLLLPKQLTASSSLSTNHLYQTIINLKMDKNSIKAASGCLRPSGSQPPSLPTSHQPLVAILSVPSSSQKGLKPKKVESDFGLLMQSSPVGQENCQSQNLVASRPLLVSSPLITWGKSASSSLKTIIFPSVRSSKKVHISSKKFPKGF